MSVQATETASHGPSPVDVFAGGGEMGARMRDYDWASTPLGPTGTWPQSLRSAIGILLTSRYAMWMEWGPELTFFCNDAYEPTLGVKSAWAIGARIEHVWAEIWSDVFPRIQTVMQTGIATWDEGLMLFLERSGYTEETYHTFSYSPLRADSGDISGVLCVVAEETERVISARRVAVLRDLAAELSNVKCRTDVAASVPKGLHGGGRDLPFTLTYLFDPDGQARLLCTTELPQGHPSAPAVIPAGATWPWPVAAMHERKAAIRLSARSVGTPLPSGVWDRAPHDIVLRPIGWQGASGAGGFLVAALNPFRPLDERYDSFIDLVAGQITSALANAASYAQERQRAEALAQLDHAKTAFFSNISHEFRTPLTLMLGPLEELLGQPPVTLSDSDRTQIQLAHRNGLRLLRLVNTLLDFSRIEAGRMRATFRPTDLAAFTRELASSFQSAMVAARLDFTIDVQPLPRLAHVDQDMWETIVLNLLSNAFKFTMDGSIVLTLAPSADGAAAVLTVRDTGTGIPESELPRLFERFHRIQGAKGRSIEGSGIGLSMVHELVKLHGGSIAVESRPGVGSTFRVTIPFEAAQARAQPADAIPDGDAGAATFGGSRAAVFVQEALRWLPDSPLAPEAETMADLAAEPLGSSNDVPAGTAGRVVLADDNTDMRDYVCRLLVARGYAVQAVADGQAALAAIRQQPPDLVLSDVMMPRMDGFALLAAIRADERLHDVAVVLLSARAGEEARVEGVGAGADDYLTKPFSARELVARVATNVKLARIRRQAMETLKSVNQTLERHVEERTQERDRVWRLSNDLMIVVDSDWVVRAANPAWLDVLGWDQESLAGRKIRELIHLDDLETTVESTAAMRAGSDNTIRLECRMRHRDGHVRSIEWTAVRDQGMVYAVGRDVTEARASAELLRQAQKMETIGQLTGGVAHDFNNLLTVIIGQIEVVRRGMDGITNARAAQIRRAGDHAMHAARRAAALTQRLLAFGRRQPLEPKMVDANRLILGMSALLNGTLGDHIQVETVLAAGLWATFADPNQLDSALLNLAVNARDAMPNGGKLTIETSNAFIDDRYAAAARELTPGQYVQISVSDTGTGMEKTVMSQAFEPFFTTKDVGQGSGLGLSQVYGFVKQSGGHVQIYSEVGEGTTVKIYLPRLVDPAAQRESDEAAGDAPDGDPSELVLVVEDDEDVRAYTTEALRELGYRVIEAPDGPAALGILERQSDVRLLFTDVGLPGGMNGRDLADAARRLRPNLPILFTTGYARNAIVHGGRLDPDVQLIGKPFTFQALAAKVREILDTVITPRILVVEDEALIRMILVSTLQDMGYATAEAGNATEAMATLAPQVERFDAIILDMGLPDRPGDALVADIRAMRRDLPIVVASGYDKASIQKLFGQDPHLAVISKPYLADDLRQVLLRLLAIKE